MNFYGACSIIEHKRAGAIDRAKSSQIRRKGMYVTNNPTYAQLLELVGLRFGEDCADGSQIVSQKG